MALTLVGLLLSGYVHTNADVILLQETWLSGINCSRISDGFFWLCIVSQIHSFAIKDTMASGIRRGRPFK